MKGVFTVIFMFSAALSVFAIPLEKLVPPDVAKVLTVEQRNIISVKLTNPEPTLAPNNISVRNNVTALMNAVNPNILVEVMSLYNKPERAKTNSAVWDEKQKIMLFNQMTAISSLTGIQYYSSSRGGMRIFYEYSSVIDGPTTKKILPDPAFTQLPASLTLYARQKDLTFGDNIYRYNYLNTADAVLFTQDNVTALSYGVIPVIGRGNMRSLMAVIDCGDSILIYAVSVAKTASVPGLYDKISSSLSNRAKAVLSWFSEKINSNL
jgi:hypothetical protein